MPVIKIFDWYLGREVTGKSIIVGLWLLVVYLFLAFLDELEGSSSERPTLVVVTTLAYSIPRMLYELSPMILLIGAILGLSVLSRQYELIAFQAGGFSKARLVGSITGYSTLVGIAIFLWGEFVVPYSETKSAQVAAGHSHTASESDFGVWFRNQNNFIFVHEVDRLHNISGIDIYQFDDQGRFTGQVQAYSGLVADDFNSLELRAADVIELNDMVLERQFHVSKVIPIEFDVLTLALQTENPASLNVLELFEVIKQRKALGLKTEFDELAMWNRLIIPLSMVVMGMFAVLFAFRRRVGLSTGHFVLLGLLFGLFYFVLQQSVGYIAILNQQPPIIGTFVVFVVFLSIAIYALFRR